MPHVHLQLDKPRTYALFWRPRTHAVLVSHRQDFLVFVFCCPLSRLGKIILFFAQLVCKGPNVCYSRTREVTF